MSEKTQASLSSFMKKQIKAKSVKKSNNSKSLSNPGKPGAVKAEDESKNPEQEEMTDEEKLEEAKKSSRHKASQFDQTDMIKKLILQNIAKYTIVISVMVIFAVGIIKFGPAIFSMLNGLLSKIIFGALRH